MDSPRLLHVASAACLLLAGCEYPTEPPLLDQRWVIPVQETTLDVEELLPTDVTVNGNDFEIGVAWVSAGETLGNLCPACLSGGPIPAPAFTGSFQSSQALPTDVITAQLSGGSIHIEINNALSFDPIAGGGTFTIDITNGVGGNSLGQLQMDGATDALPPGTTVRTINLSAGTVDTDLVARIDVTSVGGQSAVLDVINDQISISASGQPSPPADIPLLVSSATVDVTSQSVVLDPISLEQDIDSDITDRIIQGTVILDVTNPFGVGLIGTIDIGPTSKPFSIPATPTSSVEISYTGAELQSFLALPNPTLSGSGTADGTAITIAPGQEMTLEATLDFTIEIG